MAQHLLDRFGLDQFKVEITEEGDHYDPQSKCVRLTEDNYHGKHLTAVAVAAHEVGHALQDASGYSPLRWRSRLAVVAQWAQKAGAVAMLAIPVVTVITKLPTAGLVLLLLGVLSFGGGIMLHLITLPVELDASFGKALPILKAGNYIQEKDQPAVKQVLRAAAFTYVAVALASLLNFSRWIAILRR